MIAVSKAWNRLFHRNIAGSINIPDTGTRKLRRVRYSEACGPSGVPRVSPRERARRKATRIAKEKSRRRNRKLKASRRGRRRKRGSSNEC